MAAINVKNLTRKYGELVAVDSINLEIREGELFGLLGPNGAGKTTTLKMLSTLINPTSGSARICDHNVTKEQDAVRRCIGIVFQDPSLDTKLTGRENLDFHARMYGMDKKARDEKISEVLELVELTDKADILVEDYSGGMQRRLEIARGLMHYPKVLFLDEPTLGLDAQTRRHIWDYIKNLNDRMKVTMILTTHYMEEADYLCDRVAIMDHGKFVALDTPEKLKESVGSDIVSLQINENGVALKEKLGQQKWVEDIKEHNGSLTLSVKKGDEKIPKIVRIAEDLGIRIASVNLRKPTLEDVFLYYTGRTMRAQEADAKDRMRLRVRARMGGRR